MQYLSTRGQTPPVPFEETLLAGPAADGGLYIPSEWPRANVPAGKADFDTAAAAILEPYVAPWIDASALASMTKRAYASFNAPDVAPLIQIGDEDWLLELFHGPTLAFKDIAMQLLGLLFETALAEPNRRIAIVGATSGDTGAAAIEAFRGREGVDIFILHPKGRVSAVQRRMMTTVVDVNVHNIAVEGTFDDCQQIVKALFADERLRKGTGLSGVNSINWARLAIQTVYYFTAIAGLGRSAVSFSVPTGNFGDAFAGYAALRMGAPIERLCIAVNQNDILHRALSTGRYQPGATSPTSSPSMDIQVASNFERLLFEVSGRDAASVRALMRKLDEDGGYDIPADWLQAMRKTFVSDRVSEGETARTMAEVCKETGKLIDPHTAVGLAAAKKARKDGRLAGPIVTLATAHPAKFPEAVIAATGQKPWLPARLNDLFERPEKCVEAPADLAAVRKIVTEAISRTS